MATVKWTDIVTNEDLTKQGFTTLYEPTPEEIATLYERLTGLSPQGDQWLKLIKQINKNACGQHIVPGGTVRWVTIKDDIYVTFQQQGDQ